MSLFIYVFTSFIHTFIHPFVDKMNMACGFKFSVKLTGKREEFSWKKLICFFVWNASSVFETATLISTCGGPYPAENVTAWRCRSCECSFVVFRAWNSRVSPYCVQRKCRENSLLGWSDLLIHSALLDLRLTVQLLPIKVETQKKRARQRGGGGGHWVTPM